jgi:hypothetical protein
MKSLQLSDTKMHFIDALRQYFTLSQTLPEHFYDTMKKAGKIACFLGIVLFIVLSVGNVFWTLPCSWMVLLSISMVESAMLIIMGLMFYGLIQEAFLHYSKQGQHLYQLEQYLFTTLESYDNQKLLLSHLREEFNLLHEHYHENDAMVRSMTYDLFEQQYRLIRDLCHAKRYQQALLEIAFIEEIKKHILNNNIDLSFLSTELMPVNVNGWKK